jgi:CubicO group peptidase (beta-lactamase class C family)
MDFRCIFNKKNSSLKKVFNSFWIWYNEHNKQEDGMKKLIEGLDQLIQKAIDDGAFPGANYALVANEQVFLGSLGNRALYPRVEENNINTIYDLASLTKVIGTTFAILKLVEDGKLRFYASVKNILKEFDHDEVTVWDLLTHSSGLPADVKGAKELSSKEEALDRVFNKPLIYPRNTKIVYSDIGYIILGKIIEELSEMPLDAYIKKVVFEPLEMKDSCYNPAEIERIAPTEERNDQIVRGMLRGQVHDEKAYILGGVAGHAGMFSTVKDLSNVILMILEKGKFNGKQVFSEATIDLLFKKQIEESNGLSKETNIRGIGWIIKGSYPSSGDLVSDETIIHTGFTGTNIWIDRKNRVGFCMLTNRVHPTRDNLKIIDVRPRVGNYIIANYKSKGDEL